MFVFTAILNLVKKDGVEKLACDMFRVGLIRPSQAAFSSTILIIKKKSALNNEIVPDKYHISVDELLYQ